MSRPVYALLGLLIAPGLFASSVQAAMSPERSVSSSRQFVVYGGDTRLRGAVCELAEKIKRDALLVLGQRDDWQTPIVVYARSLEINQPAAPVARIQVNQTGESLKFQLELRLPAEVDVSEVKREVLRAVLMEMIYRSQPHTPVGTSLVEVPDWLLDGIPALVPESGVNALAQTLSTVLAGEMMTLHGFLQQKRALLDSPSQTVYQAYAAVLVSMLVESPAGRAHFARYVSDLDRASNDAFANLNSFFPSLGTNAAQWETSWRANVERLARRKRSGLLSCEETERELAEFLRIKIPTAHGKTAFGLEEFSQFRRDPAAPAELKRLTTDLLLLSARANPLFRPVVAEYQRIAAQLLRRRAPKPTRLAELRAMREDLIRRMSAIADYLNWFEATQTLVASGTFRDYLRAAEETVAPLPRRRDPISVYLDALESQF